MIAYLRGTIVRVYYQQSRAYLDIDVGGMGYEVQTLRRWAEGLATGIPGQVFTHLQIREDQGLIFGFPTANDRDLFRELIGVSGIGAQSALALLDTLEVPTLVEAIVTGNIRLLSTAPGIGKKTAERLILELKGRLQPWHTIATLPDVTGSFLSPALREEVELALLALGYSDREIFEAFKAVSGNPTLSSSGDVEAWIEATLVWLSQQ